MSRFNNDSRGGSDRRDYNNRDDRRKQWGQKHTNNDRRSWNPTPNRDSQQQNTYNQRQNNNNSTSWEVETPQPIQRGDRDDVEDRVSKLRSMRQQSGQVTTGSYSRRDDPSSATPRNNPKDDDPFDELHKDFNNKVRPTMKPSDVDADDDEFDRQFYLADDDEGIDAHTGGAGTIFESDRTRAREAEMKKKREAGGQRGISMKQARQSALDKDQQTWEENRLLSSGAAIQNEVDLDYTNENDTRVQLLVHQIQPPFLRDGKAKFSVIREAVPTVRDATSDFARMAREGSVTLQRLREKKERSGMRQKFWELGGSKMGAAMRVKEVSKDGGETSEEVTTDGNNNAEGDKQREEEDDGGEVDYKKSSGFAAHVKNKDGKIGSKKQSEFAKTKSIREQREYLPAYSVRESLLQTIRENNIVIGEYNSYLLLLWYYACVFVISNLTYILSAHLFFSCG